MYYKLENPDLPLREQTAIWVRVPLTQIRDYNPTKRTIEVSLGGAGWSGETLHAKPGEYGPQDEPATLDGEVVKASVRLSIRNREYDETADTSALSKRQKSKLAEAKAVIDEAKARNELTCRKVTLDADMKLKDGTILPAGMTVDSDTFATMITGMR